MRHTIEIFSEQEKIALSETQINLIKTAAITSLESEKIQYNCEITLEITDNANIQIMNKDYRGKDTSTDVLSFPLIDTEKLPRLKEFIDDDYFCEDVNPENDSVLLGDIVISIEKAIEQSIEFNQSLERELVFLTIHAVLHLLGYDHELSEEDDIAMREKQRSLLSVLHSQE